VAPATQQEGQAAGFCSLLLLHPVKYPKFQGKKKKKMKTKHLLSYCTTLSTKHNCKSANTKIILTKKTCGT